MKRPVTIVPSDNLVLVNRQVKNVDLSSVDKNTHAIQWRGAPAMTGFVEYTERVDGTKPQNLNFDVDQYNTYVYPYVVLWEKSK